MGFVIDAYVRRIAGWRASRTAHASFVLDVPEQALYGGRSAHRGGLVHHGDRGWQYVSIHYIESLARAGTEPSLAAPVTAARRLRPKPSTAFASLSRAPSRGSKSSTGERRGCGPCQRFTIASARIDAWRPGPSFHRRRFAYPSRTAP